MSYVDIPKYLKRDVRRRHGETIEAWSDLLVPLLGQIDKILAAGRPVRIEGLWLRIATRESRTRKAIGILEGLRSVSGTYYRRGDFIVLEARSS